MANYETRNIRNVAVLGAGGAGKTSLIEALLFKASATTRLGSVNEGTSICDFQPDEKERKITIEAKILHCSHKGCELNLIDTPGYPEFISAALSGIHVVESALVVIDANSGISFNTRKLWEAAEKAGLARAIVITKADGENVDPPALIQKIQEVFGKKCIPFYLPNGKGRSFEGIVPSFKPADNVPDDLKDAVESSRMEIMEGVVESDDALLEKYLEEGEISEEEMRAVTGKAVSDGSVVPVVFSAPTKEIGSEEILELICTNLPSPLEGRKREGKKSGKEEEESLSLPPEMDAPFSAQVFKTMTDPFVGKLNFFRIFSGTLMPDSTFINARTGDKEKVGHIFRPLGKDQEEVARGVPGDILSLSKIESLSTSDTLCSEDQSLCYPSLDFPQSMVPLAIEPKARGDEQKISASLSKLSEEDPCFLVRRDRETRETVVTGMSTLHLEIMLNRLKKRFDVEVITKAPKIPYRETITKKAQSKYRHKKQTGGRGQYGEVFIRLEPQERGGGFEFRDEIVGGAIPNQYIPAVEKGIKEVLEKGVISGYPVVDMIVALYDGTFHAVDSSEASFKIAGAKAFQEGFLDAKPVILEPVVNVEITIPTRFMGDISGDLNSRRGRIQGMDSLGEEQIIKAQVPLAEVSSYSTELRSITGGEGSYSLEFSHYDVVPAKLAESIIARSKKAKEE